MAHQCLANLLVFAGLGSLSFHKTWRAPPIYVSQNPPPPKMLHRPYYIWEFLKIMGTLLGIPIIRTIVYWGLYWVPLILGNYHIAI